MTLGERSYSLRKSGLTWPQVAVKLYGEPKGPYEQHVFPKKARNIAREYALFRDKKWPLTKSD